MSYNNAKHQLPIIVPPNSKTAVYIPSGTYHLVFHPFFPLRNKCSLPRQLFVMAAKAANERRKQTNAFSLSLSLRKHYDIFSGYDSSPKPLFTGESATRPISPQIYPEC